MDQPITVDADGCEASPRTVDRAADKGALRGVMPHAVHASPVYASPGERCEHAVFPTGREPPSEQPLTGVLAVTTAQHARARGPGPEATTEVVPGGPVPVLRGAARKVAVLVLGSGGRGCAAEPPLGAVGLAVTRRTDGPVIVARGDPDGLSGPRTRNRPVVGVPAGPVEAERARHRPAHGGSGRLRSTGEAARAHRKEAGEAQETGLRGPADAHPDVEVLRRTVGGQARSVLLATSAGAALLVVGARHPHGRFGLHVGRVPHAAPHHAPCPVAGVPEEETP
ncbi:universal stress protein [Streptomyces sp. NRRL S-475]|uniref:universal stress protein n=1 Tax=Streptomyces sp. NRRL S-475 TaxID=1463910 RepID=UPI0004C6AFCB|nr:universal stress protein [Streptomyces sp. NRRL S-475]